MGGSWRIYATRTLIFRHSPWNVYCERDYEGCGLVLLLSALIESVFIKREHLYGEKSVRKKSHKYLMIAPRWYDFVLSQDLVTKNLYSVSFVSQDSQTNLNLSGWRIIGKTWEIDIKVAHYFSLRITQAKKRLYAMFTLTKPISRVLY